MKLSNWLRSKGISPKGLTAVSVGLLTGLTVAIRNGGVYVGDTGNNQRVDREAVYAATSPKPQEVVSGLPELSDMVKMPDEQRKEFDAVSGKLWDVYAKEQYGKRRYDEAQSYKRLCGFVGMSMPGLSENLSNYLKQGPNEESKKMVLALACVCDDQHKEVGYLPATKEERQVMAQAAVDLVNSDSYANIYGSARFADAFPGLLRDFEDKTYHNYEHNRAPRPQGSENPSEGRTEDGVKRPEVEEKPQHTPDSGRRTQVEENPEQAHSFDGAKRPQPDSIEM